MNSLKEIRSVLSQHRDQLFAKYPLESMAIFGSFSRNEQLDTSDLDIIVEFNDKIGIRFIDLAEEIESYTGLKVDLVSRKGLKDRYYQAIKSDLVYV